jgi:hypothetical protein
MNTSSRLAPSLPSLGGALREAASILEQENALLLRHDYKSVADLLARKQSALAALESARTETPDAAATDLARHLSTLMAENRRLLGRAIEAQRRVVEIVCAAARAALPVDTYRPGGRPALGGAAPMAFRVRA